MNKIDHLWEKKREVATMEEVLRYGATVREGGRGDFYGGVGDNSDTLREVLWRRKKKRERRDENGKWAYVYAEMSKLKVTNNHACW